MCSAAVGLNIFPEHLVPGSRVGSVSSLSPLLLPSADAFGIGNPECFKIYMWRLEDGPSDISSSLWTSLLKSKSP